MDKSAVMALRDIANDAEIGWEQIAPVFKREGRLHLETY
jgi:benzoyl-CoA 2,3-dioxygenase component A